MEEVKNAEVVEPSSAAAPFRFENGTGGGATQNGTASCRIASPEHMEINRGLQTHLTKSNLRTEGQ